MKKWILICLLVGLALTTLSGEIRFRELYGDHITNIGTPSEASTGYRVVYNYRADYPMVVESEERYSREGTVANPGEWVQDSIQNYATSVISAGGLTTIEYDFTDVEYLYHSRIEYVYNRANRLISRTAWNYSNDIQVLGGVDNIYYRTDGQIDSTTAFTPSAISPYVYGKTISTFDANGHRLTENKYFGSSPDFLDLYSARDFTYSEASYPEGFTFHTASAMGDVLYEEPGLQLFPLETSTNTYYNSGGVAETDTWDFTNVIVGNNVSIDVIYRRSFPADTTLVTNYGLTFDPAGYPTHRSSYNEWDGDTYTYDDNFIWEAYTPVTDLTQTTIPVVINTYPNPFTNTVSFKTTGAAKATGSLDIYNLKGQKIKHLSLLNQSEITWDGTNAANIQVGTGIYLYKLNTPDAKATGKLIKIQK